MRKTLSTLFLLVSLFILSESAISQTLYFCEGVDNSGYPITPSSTFTIPRNGGYLYFLMRLPYEIGCTSIRYEIYSVDTYDYSETYSTTIYQDDMQTSWTWFWKKVTFYTPGYYHIYAIDCFDYTLADGFLTIKF